MKSEELSSFIMNTIMSCADAETATIIIMEELAERQVKNLDKACVINRRELLLAYHNFYLKWRKSVNDSSPNNCIEDFLASNSL